MVEKTICWVKNKHLKGAVQMINLGQKGRDKITRFEGIITGRAQYLYGCDQYCIVPAAKDDKINESHWFSEKAYYQKKLELKNRVARIEIAQNN